MSKAELLCLVIECKKVVGIKPERISLPIERMQCQDILTFRIRYGWSIKAPLGTGCIKVENP